MQQTIKIEEKEYQIYEISPQIAHKIGMPLPADTEEDPSVTLSNFIMRFIKGITKNDKLKPYEIMRLTGNEIIQQMFKDYMGD